MKILTYGEIMDGGASVFHSVAKLDGSTLLVSFEGVIRIDNPYRFLSGYLDELGKLLPTHAIAQTVIDFAELRFCNSNGFYIIMDLVECVYANVEGTITVRRVRDDDWQQETLPILLNLEEEAISTRTHFEEVRGL
ncbi:MAG: hypothetical protein Q8Q09_07275 [Deltaproteobacteria bacterium]|nr:hypothetical protein [Deltaproteobacteria bacterium]